MNKISWDNIKNSNYEADFFYCGNSIFSKKANICRLVSLIDLPISIVSSGFGIGTTTLILIKELVKDLSLLSILPIAPPSMKFLKAKKIEIILFNYEISFVKLNDAIKKLSIRKRVNEIARFFFDIFLHIMRIGCNLTGIFIPEVGRQARLIRVTWPKIYEEFKIIQEIGENENSYMITLSLSKNEQEMKDKYRELMRTYHPDKHSSSSEDKKNEVKEQAQQIITAYQSLIRLDYLSIKDKQITEKLIFLYKKHMCADELD